MSGSLKAKDKEVYKDIVKAQKGMMEDAATLTHSADTGFGNAREPVLTAVENTLQVAERVIQDGAAYAQAHAPAPKEQAKLTKANAHLADDLSKLIKRNQDHVDHEIEEHPLIAEERSPSSPGAGR